MKSLRDKFNDSSLDVRSRMVLDYGKYIDWVIEPDYFYHLYFITGEYVLVQMLRGDDNQIVQDIYMMTAKDVEEFIEQHVNIEDLWIKQRK